MRSFAPSLILFSLLAATPALAVLPGPRVQALQACPDVDPADGECDNGEGFAWRDRGFIGNQTFGDDVETEGESILVTLAGGRTAGIETLEDGRVLGVTDAYTGRLLGEVRAEAPFEAVQAAVSLEGEDVLLVITELGDAAALTLLPYDPSEDMCAQQGWYGDGMCDPDCQLRDPDCDSPPEPPTADWCEDQGWYGDGICDADCPQPDPDCESTPPTAGDWCSDLGWYGDGICDSDCPQPDPDCV